MEVLMKLKTRYEEQIIQEIQGLPVSLQKKIARMVRVFREEMSTAIDDEKTATLQFLSVCGTWKDRRSADEQINDIYVTRKSRNEPEKLK
jgi:hypothetical protein